MLKENTKLADIENILTLDIVFNDMPDRNEIDLGTVMVKHVSGRSLMLDVKQSFSSSCSLVCLLEVYSEMKVTNPQDFTLLESDLIQEDLNVEYFLGGGDFDSPEHATLFLKKDYCAFAVNAKAGF